MHEIPVTQSEWRKTPDEVLRESREQPQYTLVRDGVVYHTDAATQIALKSVQRLDSEAAQTLFDRWREDGRIAEGVSRGQGLEPVLERYQITSRSQEQGIER